MTTTTLAELDDNKTIGLLLCKGKDEVVAQYALTGYDQPIGISDYQLSKAIPENLKSGHQNETFSSMNFKWT